MNTIVDSFQEYRPLLFSIAYRMTGSASQAEDIVQDAYLRYQQTDRTVIHSTKSFLTTIVVNLCLNYLKSARVQREEYVGIWLPEPVLTLAPIEEAPETKVEQQESISLAFLVLLESLTPPERAVFLLHEVFDYSFNEIADIIEKSPENCRQLFHRAKKHVGEKHHRVSTTPESHRQLLNSFIVACQSGDLATLKELLTDDVTAWADGGGKVHASLLPVNGREIVAKLFIALMRKVPADHQLSIAEVNGAPGIIARSAGQLQWILSLEMADDHIVGLRSVLNPDKLAFMQHQLVQHPPSSSS